MHMRQEVALLRSALAQKAQAALLAREQAQHLTASFSQMKQLRASLTHNSSVSVSLQDELAAMRYSLMHSRTLAAGCFGSSN